MPPHTLRGPGDEQELAHDNVGQVKLNLLEHFCPKEWHGQFRLNTHNYPCLKLLSASSLRVGHAQNATFPQDVTSYWPYVAMKQLKREPLDTCSMLLILQLLS